MAQPQKYHTTDIKNPTSFLFRAKENYGKFLKTKVYTFLLTKIRLKLFGNARCLKRKM